MSKKMKCASFFAGVGGIDLGFEQAGMFETIYANEFDDYAADTYELNFNIKVDRRDIHEVQADEIPDFDVMLAGFPCQAFSIAGYRQGFNDEKGRGALFFELVRILEVKQPKIVFLENVKNLVGHDGGNTFRVICNELERLGYKIVPQVMNACEYGNIPQNRERIYIVCFKDKKYYNRFKMPLPTPLKTKLTDIIDFKGKQDKKYYYTSTCPFYSLLKKDMVTTDTIYQWRRKYVRENKSNVVPTLTANMGTGGHNVPLILTEDRHIRKLTPRECFNTQGFPADFKLPKGQSNTRLYKQAGNSVVVTCIKRLATAIKDSVTDEDK